MLGFQAQELKSVTMHPDLRQWRARLRLTSALVLLSFVICHLTAHCLLLVSFEDAEATRNVLMYPWRTWIGTAILVTAFFVHFSNALWSIYIRRSLRLNRWEWTQLSLGLCIPLLLMFHVVATRIAEETLDVTTYYTTVFIVQWVMFPWLGAVQMIAVVTVWTHACIGIHYWLRTKRWYPNWRPFLFGFALLLPSLALAGYVTGGNEVLREAKADPDFVNSSLGDSNLTAEAAAEIDRMVYIGWGIWLGSGAVAVCRPRHSRLGLSPPQAADAVACQWAQRADPARRHRARDAARPWHSARLGVRRAGALHDLPRFGDQGPRPASRTGGA